MASHTFGDDMECTVLWQGRVLRCSIDEIRQEHHHIETSSMYSTHQSYAQGHVTRTMRLRIVGEVAEQTEAKQKAVEAIVERVEGERLITFEE